MVFAVPSQPTSNEGSSYNRHAGNAGPFFWTSNTFTWRWALGSTITPWPTGRMLVDDVPVTGWIAPATNAYNHTVTLPNGHHLASMEFSVSNIDVLEKHFVVNTTGQPLPVQNPWTTSVRHELPPVSDGKYGRVQVSYPPRESKRYPLKERVFESLTAVVPTSQLYVRRITDSYKGTMIRYFVSLPTGDVAIESSNKYFYADATSQAGFLTGINAPRVMHIDGPRGVGTFGFTYKMVARDWHRGVYGSDTNGRVWFLFTQKPRDIPPGFDPDQFAFNGEVGEVITLAGWANKKDQLPAHNGIKESQYMHAKNSSLPRPQDQQFFEDSHEHRGNWSQVRGVKFFHEIWGICVARLMPDGTVNSRDGMEWWACDTLNHRNLYGNSWPMHPPFFNPSASFPPVGYVDTPGFTGETSMGVFLDGAGDSKPSEFLNEPWDCEVHETLKKLVWTNFAGDSICMANLNGTGAEKLVGGVPYSDSTLGIPKRLTDAQRTGMTPSQVVTFLRTNYMIDGPAVTARCVRPQGIAVDENGDIVWFERYTFAVRRLRMTTRTVETVWLMPLTQLSSSASGVNDSTVVIDTTGCFGAKGDIFIRPWRNTASFRISRDGVSRGAFFSNSGLYGNNGPGHQVDAVDYSWGQALCRTDGTFYLSGNAGASQFYQISKRQPSDGPDRDIARYNRGRAASRNEGPPYTLTHGPDFQGRLGYETAEELGALDDAALRAYFQGYGTPETKVVNGVVQRPIDDLIYFIRELTRDFDYTIEDPEMIAELQQQLAAAQAALTSAQSQISSVSAQLDTANARANAAEQKLANVAAKFQLLENATGDVPAAKQALKDALA